MKCPYAIHRSVVIQTITEYDDDGREYCNTTAENNAAVFSKCLQ